MLTHQKAHELAKSYSKNLGEVLPDIYFDINGGKEFGDCYYFDFIIVDKLGYTPEDTPMIGGAPGVIVDKFTKVVRTISFQELSILQST